MEETMDARSQNRKQTVVAFFGSAVFKAFFYGSSRVRLIAWGGMVLLGGVAVANALLAFYLASLLKIVGDMQKTGASTEDAWALIAPFAIVYIVFIKLEAGSEQIKPYYAAYWARNLNIWFSDRWIMDYKRIAFGAPPEGVGQIIADRPLKLTTNLVQLFGPLCRSLVILIVFGYSAYTLSSEVSPYLNGYVHGWLLYLALLLCGIEAYCTYRLGSSLPSILHVSYNRHARFRRFADRTERLLRESDGACLGKRITSRDKARERIDAWFDEYMRTFFPTLKLVMLKNVSQQSWQFAALAALPLMAVTGWFSLGIVVAAVYAINEMRGALLTLPNQWLLFVDIQAQAIGLQELEAVVTPPKASTVPAGYLAPAE
jgi:ABC-type long-subunit fatty acid transport system fused permease/ATPase subunit